MKFSTVQNIDYLEMNDPLTPCQESIVREVFKPQYVQQIRAYILCQKPSRKSKLFEYLNGTQKATRSLTSLSRTAVNASSLVYQSLNCRIDLNEAFGGRARTRKITCDRFASQGITGEGIFGTPTPLKPTSPTKKQTLAQFFVRKLMNPSVVSRFLDNADDNIKTLQELSDHVDKKTNAYPINTLITHPTLSPNKECRLNNATARVDHLQSRPYTATHEVSVKMRHSAPQWRTPTTSYTDFFDPNERFGINTISTPYTPLELSQPFCSIPMPMESRTRSVPVSETYTNQAKENANAGRQFRAIFTSKTCL